MIGYYVKEVVEFPLWDSKSRRTNRVRLQEMIEGISKGQINADKVEILRGRADGDIQFIFWGAGKEI